MLFYYKDAQFNWNKLLSLIYARIYENMNQNRYKNNWSYMKTTVRILYINGYEYKITVMTKRL